MKFLFLQHGWTADSFLAAIESKLGYKLDPAAPEQLPASIHRDHLGVIPQKQPGLFAIGASVIRGRITPAQIRVGRRPCRTHGDGHLRATLMQNLLLINIPESRVTSVVQELAANGLPVETNAFVRGTVACTGSEFCKLALTETKSYARWLTEQLEIASPATRKTSSSTSPAAPTLVVSIGIADIGIEGKKIKQDGKMIDAYYFLRRLAASANSPPSPARSLPLRRRRSPQRHQAPTRAFPRAPPFRRAPAKNSWRATPRSNSAPSSPANPPPKPKSPYAILPADRVPHSIEDRP